MTKNVLPNKEAITFSFAKKKITSISKMYCNYDSCSLEMTASCYGTCLAFCPEE